VVIQLIQQQLEVVDLLEQVAIHLVKGVMVHKDLHHHLLVSHQQVVEPVMELIILLLQVVMVVLVEVELHKVMHLEVLVTHLR
tara:strand:+ start:240 stop:488 length:249 start_codon:yes stop_codon:yes gene_type:complete